MHVCKLMSRYVTTICVHIACISWAKTELIIYVKVGKKWIVDVLYKQMQWIGYLIIRSNVIDIHMVY